MGWEGRDGGGKKQGDTRDGRVETRGEVDARRGKGTQRVLREAKVRRAFRLGSQARCEEGTPRKRDRAESRHGVMREKAGRGRERETPQA